MSKARKRHHQRWQVGFRRGMRKLKQQREARKLGHLSPVKLVRFDDVLRSTYPKGLT